MPAPLRPLSGRRRFTLLAVAALIVVGGALAAGSGFLLVTPVVTPAPSPAAIAPGSPSPAETRLETPAPTAQPAMTDRDRLHAQREQGPRLLPEAQLPDAAAVDRRHRRACPSRAAGRRRGQPDPPGLVARWDSPAVLGRDQAAPDRPGRWPPQPVDTGCAPPSPTTPLSCQYDSEVAFSSDGRSIVFVRNSTDAAGSIGAGGASRRWISRPVGCPS